MLRILEEELVSSFNDKVTVKSFDKWGDAKAQRASVVLAEVSQHLPCCARSRKEKLLESSAFFRSAAGWWHCTHIAWESEAASGDSFDGNEDRARGLHARGLGKWRRPLSCLCGFLRVCVCTHTSVRLPLMGADMDLAGPLCEGALGGAGEGSLASSTPCLRFCICEVKSLRVYSSQGCCER